MDAQQPQPAPEQSDISQKTVILLVLLACSISIIGTAAILYEFSSSNTAQTEGPQEPQHAEVGFVIKEPAVETPTPTAGG